MRGGHRSRTIEELEFEAMMLAANGVRELVLIAQDSTYYGLDLYGSRSLAKLLTRLARIHEPWAREALKRHAPYARRYVPPEP